jgi:hypothetical protein
MSDGPLFDVEYRAFLFWQRQWANPEPHFNGWGPGCWYLYSPQEVPPRKCLPHAPSDHLSYAH